MRALFCCTCAEWVGNAILSHVQRHTSACVNSIWVVSTHGICSTDFRNSRMPALVLTYISHKPVTLSSSSRSRITCLATSSSVMLHDFIHL